MPKISQREARRLRRKVIELSSIIDSQNKRWAEDWPSSTVICRMVPNSDVLSCVKTARALHHAVVAVAENDGKIAFFASQLKS